MFHFEPREPGGPFRIKAFSDRIHESRGIVEDKGPVAFFQFFAIIAIIKSIVKFRFIEVPL